VVVREEYDPLVDVKWTHFDYLSVPQVSRNQTLLLSCVKNLERTNPFFMLQSAFSGPHPVFYPESKGTPAYDQYVLEFNQKNKLYETSLSLLTDDGLNYLL
jgi:hypothetical protein